MSCGKRPTLTGAWEACDSSMTNLVTILCYSIYHFSIKKATSGNGYKRSGFLHQQEFGAISKIKIKNSRSRYLCPAPLLISFYLSSSHVCACKHASVMRKLIERINACVVEEQNSQSKAGGSKDSKKKWLFKRGSRLGKDDKPAVAVAGEEEVVEGMRVDFYLVVFPKFIASIVPTIEVNSTAAF